MEEYINEIKEILQLPKIEDCQNVLCVQPHPDDGDISSGATIAKLTSLGKKVDRKRPKLEKMKKSMRQRYLALEI